MEHCEMVQNDDLDDYCHEKPVFTCADCGVQICGWHAWFVKGRTICSACYNPSGGYQRPADVQQAS